MEKSRKYISSEEELEITPSGEEGVLQITLEVADAKELFNRMIENTKEYLKDYKID